MQYKKHFKNNIILKFIYFFTVYLNRNGIRILEDCLIQSPVMRQLGATCNVEVESWSLSNHGLS